MITTPQHHVEILGAANRLHAKTAELTLLKHSASYKDGLGKPCREYFASQLEEPDEAFEIDALAQIHVNRKNLAAHVDDDRRLTYDVRQIVSHTHTTYGHWNIDVGSYRVEEVVKTAKEYLKALTQLYSWPACD